MGERITIVDGVGVSRRKDQEHRVEIVQRSQRAKGNNMAFWRCSCGVSAGGRWYGSVQQAVKAAERHMRRHSE